MAAPHTSQLPVARPSASQVGGVAMTQSSVLWSWGGSVGASMGSSVISSVGGSVGFSVGVWVAASAEGSVGHSMGKSEGSSQPTRPMARHKAKKSPHT